MTKKEQEMASAGLTGSGAFYFEIRVKSRLSADQWTAWFDDLAVAAKDNETVLRGKAADHSALYGLIARLRDLAIPLLSVKVLDSDAQGKLLLQSRRMEILYTLLLAVIFSLVIGALSAVAVFLSPEFVNVGLSLAVMFALLGGLGHIFFFWTTKTYWHWLGHFLLIASFFCFLAFIPTSGILPTTIAIAVMLLVAAGGVLVLSNAVRGWISDASGRLAESRPEEKTVPEVKTTDGKASD